MKLNIYRNIPITFDETEVATDQPQHLCEVINFVYSRKTLVEVTDKTRQMTFFMYLDVSPIL